MENLKEKLETIEAKLAEAQNLINELKIKCEYDHFNFGDSKKAEHFVQPRDTSAVTPHPCNFNVWTK